MTTSEQPTGGAAGATAPTIPTVPPPIPGVAAAVPVGAAPAALAPDAPYIPAPVLHQPAPVAPVAFDARAMVESKKRFNVDPAYGGMPKSTPESEEAARKLREAARKKRTRNRWFGRTLAVVLLAAVGAGGYFAYAEFQRDDGSNGEVAIGETMAEELFPQVLDDNDDPAALTPLGEQVEILEAMEPLNDAAVPRAGGLGGAIADAREVVGQANGDAAAPSGAVTLDVVLPAWVQNNGERLPDAAGREVFSVSAAEFAAGAPDEYATFVRTLSALPQRSPGDPAFEGLPPAAGDNIVIAVVRDGDALSRVVVRSSQPPLAVDHAP